MLDQFLIGRVTRISPEAPVPIVHFDHEENRIGGAANVANNVVALGARADIVGLVGDGRRGRGPARGARARATSAPTGLVADRRATDDAQGARGHRPAPAGRAPRLRAGSRGRRRTSRRELIARARALAATAGAIVVSDYLKGAVTGRLVAELVEVARSRGVPLLVDPKIPHIGYYRGATLVTPNHHEAEIAAAHAHPHRRRRARGGAGVSRARRVRRRAHHARRTRHVAARRRSRKARCRPPRAKWPMSPAPATP